MSEVIKYNVAVHKAGLPMAPGETLSEFTNKLRTDGYNYITKQLNLTKEKSGAYMVETMSDTAIFEVYKRTEGPSEYKFYAMKFARDKNGEFELSGLTEVERVLSYRQKQTAVLKGLVAESGDDAWVQKASLFAGVI